MSTNDFVVSLAKGKIAETVFQQMFSEVGWFTVFPLGYEYQLPELAQFQDKVKSRKTIEKIRSVPDFLMISKDKKGVYLVEVKYLSNFTLSEVLRITEETRKYWDEARIFLATPDKFYFSSCNKIHNNGQIEILDSSWVSNEIQGKYLNILRRVINGNYSQQLY